MLVSPRPGTDRTHLLDALQRIHLEAQNTRNGAPGSAHQRLLRYLQWATEAGRTLSGLVSGTDVDTLVLTPRYGQLLAGVGQLADQDRLANALVDAELAERVQALGEAVAALDAQIRGWRGHEEFVIPDTSFYIQHPDKFDQVDYGAVIDNWSMIRGTRVLVPIVVIDPPGHVRLPLNDDEIIDRALAIQALAGCEVTLLTYDTGQAMRARFAGLAVKKLRTDAGEGEEPDWAAQKAKQGNGVRARRRARQAALGTEQDDSGEAVES